MEESWGTRDGDGRSSVPQLGRVVAAPAGQGVTVPFAPPSRRRPRFRRVPRQLGIDQLMADLAATESAPEPDTGIDPEERALLVMLYRELVGTVEGPVVPFPVELMEDPDYVPERQQPASLLDLASFRQRRAEQVEPAADPS
jgi:hypothetical protein